VASFTFAGSNGDLPTSFDYMNTPAIIIAGISKQYQIGGRAERYQTFREAIVHTAKAPLTRFKRLAGKVAESETFWALKDVSFSVEPGEVVGIIGRNGAGKSTLLKILSRITEPTSGSVRVRGRIGSLLEVGTGFHSELTGRENIFLNGSILGMARREIDRKFDQIVHFAGVERFIDTPVKRYSSGMTIRLGFAVAAHMEPEILIVDEVLAVGDVEFQRKCFGKMDDVARSGRTVILVSHDLVAIETLCRSSVLLERGTVRACGPAAEVVRDYLAGFDKEILACVFPEEPSRDAEVTHIGISDPFGEPACRVTTADILTLRIDCQIRRRRPDLKLAFMLNDSRERPVFASCPPDDGEVHPTESGRYSYLIRLPQPILMAQRYSVTVSMYSDGDGVIHQCPHALVFDVVPAATPIYRAEPKRAGVVQMKCHWRLQR
jgi:lipopolysaccharide transport system ATP-binding protein